MPDLIKTRMQIIQADGKIETRELELKADPGYGTLKKLIEPIVAGWMERVRVWHDFDGGTKHKYLDMFVNENGQLENLPRNSFATAIYRRNWLTHFEPKAEPESLPFIRGTAIIFDREVWF